VDVVDTQLFAGTDVVDAAVCVEMMRVSAREREADELQRARARRAARVLERDARATDRRIRAGERRLERSARRAARAAAKRDRRWRERQASVEADGLARALRSHRH
jgi:hypothetical protein